MNYQATFGVEGVVGGINYDISYTKYRQEVDRTYTNDINPALFAAALSRTDSTAFNPFCNNCNTGFSASELSLVGRTDTVDEIETVDFNISGELFDFGTGPLQYALGYQFRDIGFDIANNDVWENGATNFSWFTSNIGDSEGDRNVGALYGELLIPIYQSSDSNAFITAAEVTTSARNEDYSDFGEATVYAALGKVELIGGDVILRGSYSESFRAPTLVQLQSEENFDIEQGGFFFDPVRGGNFSVGRLTGGNPDLDAQKGETTSFGVVYTPSQLSGLFISIDYFDLAITDLIREPNGQGLLDGTEAAGSVTRGGVEGQADDFPTLDLRINNGGDLDVAGWDFSVSYSFSTDRLGDFRLYTNGVYQTKNELTANEQTVEFLGTNLDNRPTPDLRSVTGLTWDKGAFNGGLNVDYATGVDESFSLPNNVTVDRTTDDWVTVDLQFGADIDELVGGDSMITGGLSAYIGVENVFNEGLPFFGSDSNGWDRSLGDLRGRYVYGGIRKKF